MARVHPEQGELWALDAIPTGGPRKFAPDLPPDPEPGPHVDLVERWELMLKSSVVLGRISSRMAYKELMDGPLGAYVAIMREEQDDLVPLDEKVPVSTLRAELRFHFEDIYGRNAMTQSRLIDDYHATDMTDVDFTEYVIAYNRSYSGSANEDARREYRKGLRQNIRRFSR